MSTQSGGSRIPSYFMRKIEGDWGCLGGAPGFELLRSSGCGITENAGYLLQCPGVGGGRGGRGGLEEARKDPAWCS